MKLSELLNLLYKAKEELGGDIEVNVFNGYDYETPPTDEDEIHPIHDVMATGVKSFKYSNKQTATTLYIQYGD